MSIQENITIKVDDSDVTGAADAADALGDALDGIDGDASKAAKSTKKVADAAKAVAKAADKVKPASKGLFAALKDGAAKAGKSIGDKLGNAWKSVKSGAATANNVTGAIAHTGEIAKKASEGVMMIANALIKVGETVIARDNLKATLDQVTKGKGKEAFAALEEEAKGLNISVEDATAQFVKLRKAGASNIDAGALIKLRADLVAVGVSSEDADAAVKKTLDAIQSGKGADQAIKDTAKAFGAVGDGSNAAAKKAYTVEGAFTAIKLSAERVLGKLADKLGPQLVKLGQTIEDAIDNFDPAQIDDFAKTVGSAIDIIIPIVQGMATSFKATITAVSAIRDFVLAAGPVIADAWATATDAVVSAAAAVSGAFSDVGSAIGEAVDAVTEYVSDFVQAGEDLVTGFVDGIKSGIAAAASAASDLGGAAEQGLKDSLGIKSPSKVADAAGTNFGETFSDAQDASMPDLTRLVPGEAANANGSAPATAGAPGGAVTINVTVNATGQAADDPQGLATMIALETEAAIRRAS